MDGFLSTSLSHVSPREHAEGSNRIMKPRADINHIGNL
jgi:hypothetical protein